MSRATLKSVLSLETALKQAVIYCRVSTGKQEEEGYSLPTQIESCQKYANEHGIQVSPENILRETGSGTELIDRPVLSEIRDRIRKGEVKTLICHAIDRLSRNAAHLYIVSEECERYGCDLIFITEPLDTSAEGKLLMSVRGYVAEVERLKLRERVQRGRIGKLRSGKIHSEGFEKYDWRREKVDGEFTGRRLEYKHEADVVRQIYDLYGNKGWSMLKIAQLLNAKGIPSPAVSVKRNYRSGKIPLWNKKTLSNIISDADYKGETIAWRTKVVGKGQSKKQILRDPEEMIKLPEHVSEAIVATELWEFCQKRRVSNKSIRKRQGSIDCLVRGMAYCGYCGFKLGLGRGGRNGKTNVQYRCNRKWNHSNPDEPLCQGRSASQLIVDPIVWNFVAGILVRPELLKAALDAYETSGPDSRLLGELESCELAIADITKSQTQLVKSLRGVSDTLRAIIERELVELDQQLVSLQQERASLRSVIDAQSHSQLNFMSIIECCERASRNLDNISFEGRRQLLEILGAKVYINGRDNISIEMFFDSETNKFVSSPVITPVVDGGTTMANMQAVKTECVSGDQLHQLADTSLAQDRSNSADDEKCKYVSQTEQASG
ncbi:MAG TPA: recombinase family protein [Blastocatellia bacterium]|jgi:site-specific DNA recombinase